MTEQHNLDEAPVAPELPVTLDRRRALKTLGLAAGTAYMAPILLSLHSASAQDKKAKKTKKTKSKPDRDY